MSEHRWTIRRKHQNRSDDYFSTAVIDVEDGCVVITYELLAALLTQLGYFETTDNRGHVMNDTTRPGWWTCHLCGVHERGGMDAFMAHYIATHYVEVKP
jgi:hypothetical protein